MTHTQTTSLDSRGSAGTESGRKSGLRPRPSLVRYGSWWWALPALLAVLGARQLPPERAYQRQLQQHALQP